MSNEHNDAKDPKKDSEKEEPAKQFVEGIGMLFKAAKGAAAGIKKEIDKTHVGKAFEDAGREFARAATNVVEHVSAEISGKKRPESEPPPAPEREGVGVTLPHQDKEADEFDGVTAKKPAGPTPEDPGFRIAVDDEKKSG